MHQVLKSAMEALKVPNLDILQRSLQMHAGKYDRVKTLLHGEISTAYTMQYPFFIDYIMLDMKYLYSV